MTPVAPPACGAKDTAAAEAGKCLPKLKFGMGIGVTGSKGVMAMRGDATGSAAGEGEEKAWASAEISGKRLETAPEEAGGMAAEAEGSAGWNLWAWTVAGGTAGSSCGCWWGSPTSLTPRALVVSDSSSEPCPYRDRILARMSTTTGLGGAEEEEEEVVEEEGWGGDGGAMKEPGGGACSKACAGAGVKEFSAGGGGGAALPGDGDRTVARESLRNCAAESLGPE
jgi:hypothetical protein